MEHGIFSQWAPKYQTAGYEPRPVMPGTKACKLKSWNKPDTKLPDDIYTNWLDAYGNHGIGLRLGTPMPDKTVLGALDIDVDRFDEVARSMLDGPICGRYGSKGAAYFVRVRGAGNTSKWVFNVREVGGDTTHIGELLCTGSLIVIPPTIHPDIQCPYRWIGKPLLGVDPHDLPIVEV